VYYLFKKNSMVVSVTSLGPYSRFSRPEPLLFLPSGSSVVLNEAEWTPCIIYKSLKPGKVCYGFLGGKSKR
jgi:hypothetical protein